jgi:8-hydroxy-5-deazaflavin:NADPH oxidoreductase
MRLAIIGAGNVGASLGAAWSAKGHDVVYGVPDPQKPKYAALPRGAVRRGQEAVKDAAAIVLATPWRATAAAIRELGDLKGKIVIDCTNPLARGPEGLHLALGHAASGGEQVAAWAQRAAVFKTFNHTGAENMAAASRFDHRPVMFVAGDDATRKPEVMRLVSDLGFEAIDAGLLQTARLLEPLAMLWIELALKRGQGHAFAFALARRSS